MVKALLRRNFHCREKTMDWRSTTDVHAHIYAAWMGNIGCTTKQTCRVPTGLFLSLFLGLAHVGVISVVDPNKSKNGFFVCRFGFFWVPHHIMRRTQSPKTRPHARDQPIWNHEIQTSEKTVESSQKEIYYSRLKPTCLRLVVASSGVVECWQSRTAGGGCVRDVVTSWWQQ
jgi:hypothetical protein